MAYLDLSFHLAAVILTYKILSGYISETVMLRTLILGRDICFGGICVQHHPTLFALKVSRSLYCGTYSISHGVEHYFPGLWGTGISNSIFLLS